MEESAFDRLVRIPAECQVNRLQLLVEALKKEYPELWYKAEAEGKLDSFMEWRLWYWGIDKSYWEEYKRSELMLSIDAKVEDVLQTACGWLNDYYRYEQRTSRSHVSGGELSKAILSVRSPGRVVRPLMKVQMYSLCGVLFCAGSAAWSLTRGRLFSASAFIVAATDLQTVAHNCFEDRYGYLYTHHLFGSVSRLCDTTYMSLKSIVGLSPLNRNPLWRLHDEINWDLLATDTLLRQMYRHVSTSTCYFLVLCSMN